MSRVKIRELQEAENFNSEADYVAIAQESPAATRKLKVSKIADALGGEALPRDPAPGPTYGDESSGGQGTHDKIFDLTTYGIPEHSQLRWGIFTSVVEGTFTDFSVTTYTDINWTTGNVVAQCTNPDKYNHKFIQQFFAPILNNKHCYIRVTSTAATAQWHLNFIGVV